MKGIIKHVGAVLIASILLPGCATIVGGSKYYAHVVVDRSNAKIIYEGETMGTGSATFKVKRKDANKFSFSVKEEGSPEQKYNYTTRTFRGWSFAGTIILWTGMVNGVPLPWGVVLDLITGAVWKPDVRVKGVKKEDYKHFRYNVEYTMQPPPAEIVVQDVIYLKNGGIIKGIIIEQVPNESVKVKTKDENVFVFKVDEIEKLTRE